MTPLPPAITDLLGPRQERERQWQHSAGREEEFPKPPEKRNNYRESPEI